MSIDNLNIVIKSDATSANAALDKMIAKLGTLQGTLSSISSGNITNLTTSMKNLSSAINSINASSSSNLNTVKNSINSLSKVSSSNLNATATSITNIASAINKTTGTDSASTSITTYAAAVSKLGGTNATKAISNIPTLTSALQSMISSATSLDSVSSKLETASTSLSNLITSINKFGYGSTTKAIANIPSLTTALKSLITELNSLGDVNASVSTLIANLANLASQGSKVGSAVKSLSSSTGSAGTSTSTLSQYISAANSVLGIFNKTTESSTSLTYSLASAIGKLYAAYFWVTRIISALNTAITSASDYVETYNYYNVITGKIATEFESAFEEVGYDSAESYYNSFVDRMSSLTTELTGYEIGDSGELISTDSLGLGLDPQQVMDFEATILSLTNAVGLTGEASVTTSTALTMLAADMSSLKNIDLETAMDSLSSGIIGQSRALYQYGIDITTATLQQYAYAEGITKSVSEMTQAEKMQLRLLAILDQSQVAWGDMANTVDTVANQYRIFQQQVSNLATVIGSLLYPAVYTVLPYLSAMIVALQNAFIWIGNLLGIDWSDSLFSSGYTDSGLEALSDDLDDVTDSYDDATSAAESYSKTLLGIDEINALSSNDSSDSGSSDSSGSGSSIDLSSAMADALADYQSIWDEAYANMENKVEDLSTAITEAFTNMWTAITPFREAIVDLWDNGLSLLANFTWTSLEDFYNNFLVPIGNWAFGTEDSGLTRLVNIINESLMDIDWDTLNTSLANFWTAIEPYAENFGEGLIDFFEDVVGIGVDGINWLPTLIDSLTNALNNGDPGNARDWGYALGQLFVALQAFEALIGVSAVVLGIAVAVEAFSKAAALIKASKAYTTISTLATSLSSLVSLSGIAGTLISVGTALGLLVTMNPVFFPALFDLLDINLKGTFLDTDTWEGIPAILNDIFESILVGTAEFLLDVVSTIPELFSSIFSFDLTMEAVNMANEYFSSAKEAFESGDWLSIGSNVLLGILSGFLAAFTFLVEPIENFFATFFEAICGVFGIQSPATEMESVGENILLGIIEGFEGAFSDFKKSINSFFTSYVEPWFTASKWQGIYEEIKTSLEAKWEETVAYWSTSISTWWTTNVEPWFTSAKWTALYSNIKTSLMSKWSETVSSWSSSISSWWNTYVSPYFTSTKWTFSGIKTGVSGSLSSMVSACKSTISSYYSTYVSPYFTYSKWYFSGIKSGLYAAFSAAISSIKSAWNSFASWFNSKLTLSFGSSSISIGSLPTYATGGFPEDGLFMANQSELVGQFSNGKSAVVNNAQIIEGVTQGVENGVISAMMAMGGSSQSDSGSVIEFTLQVDTETLYKLTKKGERKTNGRYSVNAVLA